MTSGSSGTETDKADGSARRRSRSFPFLDTDWDRIEAFAEARGLTGYRRRWTIKTWFRALKTGTRTVGWTAPTTCASAPPSTPSPPSTSPT